MHEEVVEDLYLFTQNLHGNPELFGLSGVLDWSRAPYTVYSDATASQVVLPEIITSLRKFSCFSELSFLEKLSFILWSVYGCTGVRLYPMSVAEEGLSTPRLVIRRAVAAGGARYPVDIYLSWKNSELVYVYSPIYHSLVSVGKKEEFLKQYSLGMEVGGLTFYLGLLYGRTAFKYKNFSYRLSSVDAGVVLGRLWGIFNLCNFHNKLEVINILPDFTRDIISGSVKFVAKYHLTHGLNIHVNTSQLLSYIEVIKQRKSMANFFKFQAAKISDLLDILKEVGVFVLSQSCHELVLYCAVLNVADISPGYYQYDVKKNSLILVHQKINSMDLANTLHLSSANVGLSSFIVHIAGDLDWRVRNRGIKDYFLQQYLVGAMMDIISINAARLSMSAHPYLGFNKDKIKKLYQQFPSHLDILGKICVGFARDFMGLESSVIM